MSKGKLHLVHLTPPAEKVDWVTTSGALPAVERKLGVRLSVTRPAVPDTKALGSILAGSKEERERTLVLVCLPPKWVGHLTELQAADTQPHEAPLWSTRTQL